MGEWVWKTSGVVPHLTGVGNAGLQVVFRPVVQLAVAVGVGAVEQGRRLWPVGGPVGAALLMVTVKAAHGQHHVGRLETDLFAGDLVDGKGSTHGPCLMVQGG